MLELLTFDVVVQSPYTYLYEDLKALRLDLNKRVRNAAWAFVNDSCFTVLCLLMPAKDVSIVAIYFALQFAGETVLDNEEGTAWWETQGGSAGRIQQAMDVMVALYEDNPLNKSENPYERVSGYAGEDIDKTRAQPANGNGLMQSVEHRERLGHDKDSSNSSNETATLLGDVSISREGTAAGDGMVGVEMQNGASDAALKAAANDPATHAQTSSTNGQGEGAAQGVSDGVAALDVSVAQSTQEAEAPQTVADDTDRTTMGAGDDGTTTQDVKRRTPPPSAEGIDGPGEQVNGKKRKLEADNESEEGEIGE